MFQKQQKLQIPLLAVQPVTKLKNGINKQLLLLKAATRYLMSTDDQG